MIPFDGEDALHRADTIAHVFKGKYPDANIKILDDMLTNLQSLRNKNESLVDEIDVSGVRTEKPKEEKQEPKRDPKIKNWADKHGVDYDKAEQILRARGYNG